MEEMEGFPIIVDGDDSYVSDVTDVLKIIKSQRVGSIVIDEIGRLGRILLKPYAGLNATTDYQQGMAGILAKVVISFSPNTWAVVTNIYPGIKFPNVYALFPGMTQDEVLLHEMVHAVNGLGPGFSNSTLQGVMAPYENEEEFFTILTANLYISEKGRPPRMMRNSHALSPQGMPDWEAISEVFLFENANYSLIDKFCRQNDHFTRMLARVHSRFNPIRSYYLFWNSPDPYPADLPDPGDIPMPRENFDGTRQIAYETRVPLNDSRLIEILQPRFRADDVAGYGNRLRQFQSLILTVDRSEAFALFARLRLRPPGDRVAQLFHDHLSTTTRNKTLAILKRRLAA